MNLTYLGCFTRMAPGNDKESSTSLTPFTGSALTVDSICRFSLS